MFDSRHALRYAAWVLGVLALVPGLPALAFAPLAIGAYAMSRRAQKAKTAAALGPRKPTEEKKAERITNLLSIDALELEVGYALLPVIDLEKGGELPARVTALRKQLATDLGIVLPSVHLRDNLRLDRTSTACACAAWRSGAARRMWAS